MRRNVRLTRTATAALLAALLALAANAPTAEGALSTLPAAPPAPARQSTAAETYGRMPMRFEPNLGQAPAGVKYLARGQGYMLALGKREADLVLHQPISASATQAPKTLHLSMAGGKARPRLQPEQLQTSHSNYFIGRDRSRWHSGVANYGAVRYRQVYPGIDWVLYGNPQQLEYDLVVAPHADPQQIRLRIGGADSLALDAAGDLVVSAGQQTLVQHRPVVYQTVDGERREVTGGYRIEGRQVAFELGAYDHSRELTIDPVLVYSTYYGGDATDVGAAIAVDSAGNVYVAGTTTGHLPVTQFDLSLSGPSDGFVAKFDANGRLVFATYLGGSDGDNIHGIAVDANGYIYLAGTTSSTDFPLLHPFQATLTGTSAAFYTQLLPSGAGLYCSTYLGGNNESTATAIAVDSGGRAYVAGYTSSTTFPVLNAYQGTYGGGSNDAFVAKFSVTGSALAYSTYLGGSNDDQATGIALDSALNAYVTGSTSSSNFPVTAGAVQTANGGSSDGFVTKLGAAGNVVTYSTYLGGIVADFSTAIAVDSAGNAYVAGQTSGFFPGTANGLQPNFAGYIDGFVTKLNPAGTARLYSTYLGGRDRDVIQALAIDSAGNAYVAGMTVSSDFPLLNPLQTTVNAQYDAFVAKLNAAGTGLVYSTRFGGSDDDAFEAIAVDAAGNAYLTGYTASTDYPTLAPFQPQHASDNGIFDAVVTRIGYPPGPVQFDSAHYSVDESAGTATITVERGTPTESAASVHYAASAGSAIAGTDFTAVSGALTWAPGETAAKSFSVPIIDNTTAQADRTINLALSSPTLGAVLGTPSTAVLTINDDDTTPLPAASLAFGISQYSVSEAAGTATVTVVRGGNTNAAASVTVATAAGGSAVAGTDYTATSQTLSWLAGDSSARSFSIPIIDNTVESGDKTVNLALSNPVGAALVSPSTAVLSIVDDEAGKPGLIQLSGIQYFVAENGGSAVLTLTRSGGASGLACVNAATGNGSAVAGTDYAATSANVCFNDNDAAAKTFSVPIINNSVTDGTRSFVVNLGNPSGGGLGAPASAAVTIQDDDTGTASTGKFQLTAATYSVAESVTTHTVNIGIKRVSGSVGAVTVHLLTSDGTATAGSDYVATDSVVSWADGDALAKSVKITILDDALVEGNETFNVTLANPSTGTSIGTPATAVVTIVDDASGAQPGHISFGSSTYTSVQGDAAAIVTVNRTGGARGAASVQLVRPADPLTHGQTPEVQTISFADGDASTKVIEIPMAGYNLQTGTQRVPLTLSNPTNTDLAGGPAAATLVVQDGRTAPAATGGSPESSGSSGGAFGVWSLLPLLGIAGLRRRRTP